MSHSQAAFRTGADEAVRKGQPKRRIISTKGQRVVSIMILMDKGSPDSSRLGKSKFDNVISQ